MLRTKLFTLSAACCVTALFTASNVLAGSVSYGDFSDPPEGVVMYLDVTESGDNAPQYGEPEVTVNTLDFDPGKAPANQFIASSSGGGAESTDGQLNFDLMTPDGNGVTSLSITESGDYDLFGSGTALTTVGAGIFIEVSIIEVDGVALGTPIEVTDSSFVSFDLPTDGPVLAEPWSNGLLVEFGPALSAAGISFSDGVTKAEVAINDTLAAISEQFSIAEIVKKDFTITPGGDLVPNDIPEPASVVLLLMSFLGGSAAVLRFRLG